MRLIDADALKKAFDFDSDVELEVGVVQFGIDNAPTVEAVPVVRCKDCKKYIREVWERKLNEPHSLAETEYEVFLPGGCIGFEDAELGYCYAGEGEKIECD